MPWLDMSDALTEPNFSDTIVVHRTAVTVNDFGESAETVRVISNIIAVVNTPGPNDLVRSPEADSSNKTLTIVTKFRLQTATPGYKPDIVLWHGDTFIITKSDDYSTYGRGFIQATAESYDYLTAKQPA